MSQYNTYPNYDNTGYSLEPIYKEQEQDNNTQFLKDDQKLNYDGDIKKHSCYQRNKHIIIPIMTLFLGLIIGMTIAGLTFSVIVS